MKLQCHKAVENNNKTEEAVGHGGFGLNASVEANHLHFYTFNLVVGVLPVAVKFMLARTHARTHFRTMTFHAS